MDDPRNEPKKTADRKQWARVLLGRVQTRDPHESSEAETPTRILEQMAEMSEGLRSRCGVIIEHTDQVAALRAEFLSVFLRVLRNPAERGGDGIRLVRKDGDLGA